MILRFPPPWASASKLDVELGFETTSNANYRLSCRFSSYTDGVHSTSHSIRCCNSTSPSIIPNSTNVINDSTGSLGKDICEGKTPTSSSSRSHKLESLGTKSKSSTLGSLPWKPSHPFQRALLVLIFLLTFAVQTSAFVMSPTRWHRRPRPLQLFSPTKQDNLLNECQMVIDAQPAVLVHPAGECIERTKWNGTVVALTDGSDPGILPFVDRLTTVTSMTSTLMDNLDLAQRIYGGEHIMRKALSLVGSGAVYGVGKTRIAPVVCECLESLASADQRVIKETIVMNPFMTFHQMWHSVCESVPELADLSTSLKKDMVTEPEGVMAHTARYLTAHNLILFLHLDEFRPFGKLGDAKDERASFHNCWRNSLIDILSTPRICLYISGRMPYYETLRKGINQRPCQVHSAQLELFDPAVISSALNKIFIPGAEGSDGGTAALSEVLNCLPTPTGTSGTEDVARRLHELTGGVPRFVEHALCALLSDPTFGPAVFKHNLSAISTATLDRIFEQSGSVYPAVYGATMAHFGGVNALLLEAGSEEAQQEHLAGFIDLLLLRGTGIELSEEQVQDLVESTFMPYNGPVVAHLLEEAHFWTIHRSIKKRDEGGGLLTFALSPPMLDALAPQIRGLTALENFVAKLERDTTGAGSDAKKAVKLALTFHSHLASLVPDPDWLGLLPANETKALTAPRKMSTPRSNALLREMPTLPRVDSQGKIRSVQSLADIVHGRSAANKRMCPPHLVGKLLTSLSPESFHVFATAPDSACADFIVRLGSSVWHLQVEDKEERTESEYLDKIAQIAPIVQSSLDLHHTLVLVVTEPTGLAKALTSQESLYTKEELASKLEARVTQREEEAKSGDKGAEYSNMHAAAKLVRDGRLAVKVLDEAQLGQFFRHNELKKFLKTASSTAWAL